MTMTNLHGLSPEWFTPDRCTWHVQDEFVNDESFLAVYPLEHMGQEITQEQADWVKAQLNRPSEAGYFGFNIKSPQYDAFIDLLLERINDMDSDFLVLEDDEQREVMKHFVFSSMAQVFWE